MLCSHGIMLIVRKLRRLVAQISVGTERGYWTVPCEQSIRSDFFRRWKILPVLYERSQCYACDEKSVNHTTVAVDNYKQHSRPSYSCVLTGPGLWREARLVVTLFLLQTFLFFMCKSWYSHANKSLNMIMKNKKVRNKTRSPRTSLLLKSRALITQL